MERSSGILLHISSLPGDEGIGSLGKEAFQFVDFLAQTKQKIWQICHLDLLAMATHPTSVILLLPETPCLLMFINL